MSHDLRASISPSALAPWEQACECPGGWGEWTGQNEVGSARGLSPESVPWRSQVCGWLWGGRQLAQRPCLAAVRVREVQKPTAGGRRLGQGGGWAVGRRKRTAGLWLGGGARGLKTVRGSYTRSASVWSSGSSWLSLTTQGLDQQDLFSASPSLPPPHPMQPLPHGVNTLGSAA